MEDMPTHSVLYLRNLIDRRLDDLRVLMDLGRVEERLELPKGTPTSIRIALASATHDFADISERHMTDLLAAKAEAYKL